jgi:photosystem II stability/assembly factor-like uncharacterized protein
LKSLTIFIIFLIINNTSRPQWILDPAPTGMLLNRVRLISSSVGWIVGENGIILRTTDGGTSWQTQSSGTTVYLNDVSFTDANNGTVVGDNGIILRTTNGGSTWQSQSSGTTYILHGVSFTDANTGTVVGQGGTILRTTNGGSSWLPQSNQTTAFLRGVSFTDINNGTIVGSGSLIFRTTNGGDIWSGLASGTTWSLENVVFTDTNTGIAVGGGSYGGNTSVSIIIRTTNGGTTWTQKLNISGSGIGPFSDVSFSDANNGAVVNFLSNGPIWRTTDGGITWGSQITPDHEPLFSVSFADVDNGIAVGSHGTILRTTNGGVTFIGNENKNSSPQWFTLSQNYPNPFNPGTVISYSLPSASNIKLIVFNTLGQTVKVLENGFKNTGNYSVNFNATELPSGIYFYKLEAGQFSQIKKMILLK